MSASSPMFFRSAHKYLLLIFLFFPLIPIWPHQSPAVKAASIHQISPPTSNGSTPPLLSAESILIYDLGSQSVIYEKNSDTKLNPASLTKLMTAEVAISSYAEDQVITAYSAPETLGNTMHLTAGDQLSATDLLQGLLISSANDAALTFAENFPGGYNQFIKKMNDTANQLDMPNTHFTNVSGVEDINHYSTARDLTKLTLHLLENSLISKIVATQSIDITSLTGRHYLLKTTNQLLGLPGILGVKTGWTPLSGECLITLIDRQSHPLLITLLKSNDRFGETKTLIDWVYSNFNWDAI